MDVEALERCAARLGDTVFDPALWPDLLQDLAESAGACGAVLLQAGVPTTDVPWSPSLGRVRETYYGEGWNHRDLRAMRSVAAVKRGLVVITDEDLATRDEVDHDPYYTSFLASHGLGGFAAVAFHTSASALCGLVFECRTGQRTFDDHDRRALALLEPRLAAVAELTRLIGEASLRSSLDVLDRLSRPALVLGAAGDVVGINAAATALLDDDLRIRAGALVARDDKATTLIRRACGQACLPFGTARPKAEPIIVRRRGRLPLILRPIPTEGAAGSFLLGSRLLVTITDPRDGTVPTVDLLRELFGLTGAEARLAAQLAAGLSLHRAAETSGIQVGTVRSQLKSVFSRTGTRRQAELVKLLGRL